MKERVNLLIANENIEQTKKNLDLLIESQFNLIICKIFNKESAYQELEGFDATLSIKDILIKYSQLNIALNDKRIIWAIDVKLDYFLDFLKEKEKYDMPIMVDLMINMETPINEDLLLTALNYKDRIDINIIYFDGENRQVIDSNNNILRNLKKNIQLRNWDISFMKNFNKYNLENYIEFLEIQRLYGNNNDYNSESNSVDTVIKDNWQSKSILVTMNESKYIPMLYNINRYKKIIDIHFDKISDLINWKNKIKPKEELKEILKNKLCVNCEHNIECINLALYDIREQKNGDCSIKNLLTDLNKS
jgi:hypothetical protein